MRVHLCADTATALATFISDLTSAFGDNKDDRFVSVLSSEMAHLSSRSIPAAPKKKGPTALTELYNSERNLMGRVFLLWQGLY